MMSARWQTRIRTHAANHIMWKVISDCLQFWRRMLWLLRLRCHRSDQRIDPNWHVSIAIDIFPETTRMPCEFEAKLFYTMQSFFWHSTVCVTEHWVYIAVMCNTLLMDIRHPNESGSQSKQIRARFPRQWSLERAFDVLCLEYEALWRRYRTHASVHKLCELP